MAYADYVLSRRPDSYYSLHGASGNFDVIGGTNGVTNYTAGTDSPIVAGYQCGTLSSSLIKNTNLKCLSQVAADDTYSIELWGKLKINPFYGYQNIPIDILYTDSPGNKIYIENSYITFLLTATDGTEYRAQVKHSDWDEPFHIVASYASGSLALTVNTVSSREVQIDLNKVVGSSTTNIYVSSEDVFISNIAMYRHKLNLNEIVSNYTAGLAFIDKQSMSISTGAIHYNLSKSNSARVINKKIYSNSFYYGNLRNIIIQDNVLKNINYTGMVTRNSSGSTISSTTGGSGLYVGGTGNTIHCKIDAYPALDFNSGFIGLKIPVSTGNSTDILTISNTNLRKSWAWKLNSNSNLILNINEYSDNFTTISTTASFTYSTTLTSNNLSQKIWFLFDQDGVRVSNWSLTANTFNQYSSSDYINSQVNFDDSTEIIIGSDELYAGSGSQYQLNSVWIGSNTPNGWTGNFSDLELSSNNNVSYLTTSSLSARTRGEFTYTFDIGMQLDYAGSNIEFDLNSDTLYGAGSSINIKHNNGDYYECTHGKYLPAIPYSGTFGDGTEGTVITGPITLKAVLETTDIDKNLPELRYLDVNIYRNSGLYSIQNVGEAVVVGENVSFRNNPVVAGINSTRLNCTFSEPGYVYIPTSTGNNKSIEFNFAYKGLPNANSTIISAFDDNNKLVMSTTGLVSVSGWPSDTVYLNGRSIGTTGATAQTNSVNHVLIVGSTGLTGPVYLNASVTGGGATGYFSSLTGNNGSTGGVQVSYGYISMWPNILTGATGGTGQTGQTRDVIESRLGSIVKTMIPENIDSFSIVESSVDENPVINYTPWQQF